MIIPLIVKPILVDLYHNGVFQITVSQFTHLDIRRQICEQNLEGYTLKMNPQFYHLFDKEDEIEDLVVTLKPNGEIDTWFPEYDINAKYQNVGVFSEALSAVLKIRRAQKEKEKDEK